MGVADPRGKVWRLKPDTSVWEVGEPVHVDELPPPMSLHTMVRVGGYQQQRRGPPAWAPNSKDASQEGYLVFGGELESMPYCQQLDTIYYVEPPSPGRSTSWQIVTANLDVSMTDARLKRSGHGAVVHAYFNDGENCF